MICSSVALLMAASINNIDDNEDFNGTINDWDLNEFPNTWLSLFMTIVMFTGEINAELLL